MPDFEKILATIPTPVLLEAAKVRRSKLKDEQGEYATTKKFVDCPYCKEKFGVRELRRHKPDCPRKAKSK